MQSKWNENNYYNNDNSKGQGKKRNKTYILYTKFRLHFADSRNFCCFKRFNFMKP